jgi:hypothetical protein
MTTASITHNAPRELDRRLSADLEVALFWEPGSNTTSVEIHHASTGETVSFRVPTDRALDAFHHPFAHLWRN